MEQNSLRYCYENGNNDRRFLAADPEYNNLEYSDSELLVYEFESSNEEEFNNGNTELSEEEAKHGSKCTQQCKNKGLQEVAQGSMSLDNFFKPVKKLEVKYEMSDSDISDLDIENNSSISEKINKLSNNLKNMKNMNVYEYLHLLVMHKYLAAIFNHEESYSCVKLSLEISQQDVQSSCLHFIRTMGERITAEKFQNYVQNNVLPHYQQSIYYDRYEHSDIVQYRIIFLEKMKDLETLMSQFVGENMEIIINPEISEEKKMHILVTYDECIFYANNGHLSVWASLGMPLLCKKEKGKALIISEFLTETRDHFTIISAEINELNLLLTFPQEALANKAIPIFEATHPNCIGVFAFDNSTNYSTFTSDTLCTKNMNLYPNGKQLRLCDGWFINTQGEQITQSMIFPKDLSPNDSNYIFCD
ncbi:6700_t:CDS:2 [Scutellospora calospora]|uniref:6700_t:CDS:1 n=1 Tax=Scutellospora calospora TaxID=85575 RepID=A0ACA9KFB6_9GLOM|nr:6700_t:CDS:2 [Scutellospora calospora]